MKIPIFPVTPKEAEEYGIENRTEANRNCPFAKRLAQLRQEKGLTQQKLADILKCSKSTISLYETGDTVPDAKNIVGLCDIFGVSCDYLLCQTDYRRPENERLTVEEMGYSEKAAQKLNDLDLFKVRDKSTHVELPFSPKGSFNLLVEDSRFSRMMQMISDAYQMKIGAARWKEEYGSSVEQRSDLEIEGYRMMLYTIGEGSMPLNEVVEVYLQRASELLKEIVRDFPISDPESGVEYHMFIHGNVYNPLFKDKYHERVWEHDTRTDEEFQKEVEDLRQALLEDEDE